MYENIDDFIKENVISDIMCTGVMEFAQPFNDTASKLTDAMQNFKVNQSGAFLKRIFMGCKDCNSKMTVNRMIYPLMRMMVPLDEEADPAVIPARGRGAPRGGRRQTRNTNSPPLQFNSETGMFLILLTAMLGGTDVVDINNSILFLKVPDAARAATWRFRFAIAWCMF